VTPYAAQSPLTLSLVRARQDGSARLHTFDSKAACSIVLLRNRLQRVHALCIAAFSNQELGRFFQSDNGDAQNGHDEDEGARGVPDIAPSLVVVFCACGSVGDDRGVVAGEVGNEAPGEEAGYKLADSCLYSSQKVAISSRDGVPDRLKS
jgi:hypothetical protein